MVRLMNTYEQGRNAMKDDIIALLKAYGENAYLKDLVERIERLK